MGKGVAHVSGIFGAAKENMDMGNYDSKKRAFFSRTEQLIYGYLEGMVDAGRYKILPHLSIAETFTQLIGIKELWGLYDSFFDNQYLWTEEDITDLMERKLELSHFDFVIFDMAMDLPVLVIEVNGHPSHGNDETIKASDAFKAYVCQYFGRPFIALDLYKYPEYLKELDLKEALISAIKESPLDRSFTPRLFVSIASGGWRLKKRETTQTPIFGAANFA